MRYFSFFFLLMIAACTVTVPGKDPNGQSTPTSVEIKKKLLSVKIFPEVPPALALGATLQFTAVGTFDDGSTQDFTELVEWISSNPAVMIISNQAGTKGLATGTGQGSASISAAGENIDLPAVPATTTDAALVSLRWGTGLEDQSYANGVTQDYTIFGLYTDNIEREVTHSVALGSSAPAIASFSNGGVMNRLKANAVGSATVTASLLGQTISTSVTVTAPELLSITVSPAGQSLFISQSQNYTATGVYTNGNGPVSVTWNSTNPAIASIDGSGLAQALAAGSTTISATNGTITGQTTLTVNTPAVTAVTLSPASGSCYPSEAVQFTATAVYNFGPSVDVTSTATWYSNDGTVATVASGEATCVQAGTSQISATYDGVTSTVNPTLTVNAPFVTSVAISSGGSCEEGSSYVFQATASYNVGDPQDVTALATWSAIPAGYASISQGIASCNSPGTTTVTAAFGGQTSVGQTLEVQDNGPKVICTELYRQKLLPKKIWEADTAFSQKLVGAETIKNYHAWGIPVAKLMSKSKLLTALIRPLATAWAYQMAYEMGEYPEANWVGAFLVQYGVPASNFVGSTIRKFQ